MAGKGIYFPGRVERQCGSDRWIGRPIGCWGVRIERLDGHAGVGDGKCVVVYGVFDRDYGLVVVDKGKNVDRLVWTSLDGFTEEAPNVVSQFVLFGNETQSLGYPVVDDMVAVPGKGLEVCEQVINELVQRNLNPTVGRLEGQKGGFAR